MRLDKFLCKSTELSREQAREHILDGDVRVNGYVQTDPAKQVHENNEILFKGARLAARASRYIMMNKPRGTICSNVDDHYPSLFGLLNFSRVDDLHLAGRLDVNTTGLVFITDDGRWSQQIISPKSQCYKTYKVGLKKAVGEDAVRAFAQGIQLQGEKGLTLPAKLQLLTGRQVLLSIVEGKFHQVKRMFAALGNRVVTLHRQQIGDVVLDPRLQPGQWRELTPEEVASFSVPDKTAGQSGETNR
ncbi:pseudouridine synthase [Thalassomonas viridans]|uniref:Pseudouridine synthase n=1 Tax=Thalassomonas viridans TaxID=137584 RepID=A0AAF0CA85_9GAMM|nr:pseudouridine synthase [Thalassomonas viridans]WDE05609.1 pseudouridine synthase [Thalassomonas viridans]